MFREVATAGGGGPVRLGKVLMCSVTSVVTVWVRDLGADVSNVKKTRGCTYGITAAGGG